MKKCLFMAVRLKKKKMRHHCYYTEKLLGLCFHAGLKIDVFVLQH